MRNRISRNGASSANPVLTGGGTTSCTCSNVLVAADIFLIHDGAGAISGGIMDFTFDNIQVTSTAANCETITVPIQQSFGLHFIMSNNVSLMSFSPCKFRRVFQNQEVLVTWLVCLY